MVFITQSYFRALTLFLLGGGGGGKIKIEKNCGGLKAYHKFYSHEI